MSAHNAHSDSDDSDDADYIPGGEENDASEEESVGSGSDDNESGDEDDTTPRTQTKRKKKGTKKGSTKKRRRGGADESSAMPAWKEELVAAKKEKKVDDEKAKTDALWEDFLKDTTPKPANDEPKKEEASISASVAAASSSLNSTTHEKPEEAKKNDPLASLFGEEKKVDDIPLAAGSPVAVKPPIRPGSLLSGRPLVPSAAARGRGRGLLASGGIGSVLSKGKKVSVLEQSKSDWGSFKQQEGIEDELRQHAQSRNSYVEKQDFLSRVDYRQFEQEKAVREINRRRQNK